MSAEAVPDDNEPLPGDVEKLYRLNQWDVDYLLMMLRLMYKNNQRIQKENAATGSETGAETLAWAQAEIPKLAAKLKNPVDLLVLPAEPALAPTDTGQGVMFSVPTKPKPLPRGPGATRKKQERILK